MGQIKRMSPEGASVFKALLTAYWQYTHTSHIHTESTILTHSLNTNISHSHYSQDHNDPKQLLSKSNIDRGCLERFALEATSFATEGALGNVEFERNNRGEKDVALFDFTSLFAAENAARIIERKGQRLLLCLAGDSLIEVSRLRDVTIQVHVLCVWLSECVWEILIQNTSITFKHSWAVGTMKNVPTYYTYLGILWLFAYFWLSFCNDLYICVKLTCMSCECLCRRVNYA